MKQIRDYLANEQRIAQDPATPEWQVANQLCRIAEGCNSIDEFNAQANAMPIDGPEAEAAEARNWLDIYLGNING